jgi:hypothetical protein
LKEFNPCPQDSIKPSEETSREIADESHMEAGEKRRHLSLLRNITERYFLDHF